MNARTLDETSADSVSVPVNCTIGVENASLDCSLIPWATFYSETSPGNCSAEPYAGSVCRQQLLAWHECAVGGVEEVLLDGNLMETSQEERERDTAKFHHFLREFTRWLHCTLYQQVSTYSLLMLEMIRFSETFGSDHCQRAAGFLVCQSWFPLCNCESGQSLTASREECETISMVECKEEWTTAKEYSIPLPNCTDLPEEAPSENHE